MISSLLIKSFRMKFKYFINYIHSVVVMNRRVKRLSIVLSDMFGNGGGSVLDVGCGDGTVALALKSVRNDLKFSGVDILMRPNVAIPTKIYDGINLPYQDREFDYAMIIDVLHHTDDPVAVLSECLRVAKHGVIIKDHILSGFASKKTLRFMDWVGNFGHDVRLPYNYLREEDWREVFLAVGCEPVQWKEKLKLYPVPFTWLFDRSLHFVARVCK